MRRVVLILALSVAMVSLNGCQPAQRLIGAGDVSECSDTTRSKATAELLRKFDGSVIALGDLAYERGTTAEFACFDRTWGREKARMRPVPGNHEYGTPEAAGYFSYFDKLAGPDRRGVYSFEVGPDTRVFALNSEANIAFGADYVRWVSVLSPRPCVVAMWHKPYRSSGAHQGNPSTAPLWQALYDVGGDLVLNGHDHDYERFGLLDRGGSPVSAGERGMREIIVGTGGRELRAFGATAAGSKVRNNTSFGIIEIDLQPDRAYVWRFHPTTGTLSDSGTGKC